MNNQRWIAMSHGVWTAAGITQTCERLREIRIILQLYTEARGGARHEPHSL